MTWLLGDWGCEDKYQEIKRRLPAEAAKHQDKNNFKSCLEDREREFNKKQGAPRPRVTAELKRHVKSGCTDCEGLKTQNSFVLVSLPLRGTQSRPFLCCTFPFSVVFVFFILFISTEVWTMLQDTQGQEHFFNDLAPNSKSSRPLDNLGMLQPLWEPTRTLLLVLFHIYSHKCVTQRQRVLRL